MSDDQSARLGLPYLAAGQMQKHVTLNEALTRLDVLVQSRVESRTLTTPPGDPDEGSLYLMPADATDAWAGFEEHALVRFEGGWSAVAVAPGHLAMVADEQAVVVWDGAEWSPLGLRLGEIGGLARLGINTSADADNPFAARLNKALLTALPPEDGGDGDLRLTLNKSGPADVGSLLFQSGYGGRAEIGLIGTDALSLKVSGDGETWSEVFSVGADARPLFARGALRQETSLFTTSGVYAVPDWARRLVIECVGAGGGGGSGGTGPAGTLRTGGGGGGAGAVVSGAFSTDDLEAELTVTVGAGGGGGLASTGGAAGDAGSTGGSSSVASGDDDLVLAAGGGGGDGGSSGSAGGGAGGLAPFGRFNAGGGAASSGAASVGLSTTAACGPGGGGAGGGVSAADAEIAGEGGGYGFYIGGSAQRAQRGAAGPAGEAGGDGEAKTWSGGLGAGGGGGGGGHAAVGGQGGAGGNPGGGGGGGGAGRSATGSGAGGQGGHGEVRITAIG